MKKSFPLEDPPHKPPRVIDRIKSDVRKYLKRERRKELPDGVDFWDFDCRAGKESASASEIHISELTITIDNASQENWQAIYIEILAKPGRRKAKSKESETETDGTS